MKKIILIPLFMMLCLLQIRAESYGKYSDINKETYLYAVKGTDSLFMDCWFDPSVEIETKRPVLMFAFGGGFMGGERWQESYIPYFRHFTKQGFMVVSIDYRLGMKIAQDAGQLSNETFVNALLYSLIIAVEDFIDATAYVIDHAGEWNADIENIIISGSSAGAVTCLHAEYEIANRTELTKRLPSDFNYAGVISFAGAILTIGKDLNWEKAPCPILLFHGDGDDHVPYNVIRQEGYGGFGSKYISEQLTQMNVPHWFYSVENAAHEIAGTPMIENLNELDTFIEKLVLKKQTLIIQTNIHQIGKPEIRKDFTKITDFIH